MKPKTYQATEHDIQPHLIDRDALYVIERLCDAGFEAYLVGGSVRDLLIKKRPKDSDVATSARPEEIKKLFRRCFLIGKRFRLAHVRVGHNVVEVSTFRQGANHSDLILEDNVWGTPEEDVMRRDFTINGLFYDPMNHRIIDYVGGWDDIHQKVLRTIGTPEVRFKQDPVRMIRFLKFHARLGFTMESSAYEALLACREEILKSSPSRILEEIMRMLESCAAGPFFEHLMETEMLPLLFPNMAKAWKEDQHRPEMQFLKAMDQVNEEAERYPIERPALVAALLYPLLEREIDTEFLRQNHLPHLGEVMITANQLIKTMLVASFTHFPKRISAIASYVMSMQYRLTPLSEKRFPSSKLFKMKEFPMVLRLLKIRSYVHPHLEKTYVKWKNRYRNFLVEHKHHGKHPHPPPEAQEIADDVSSSDGD